MFQLNLQMVVVADRHVQVYTLFKIRNLIGQYQTSQIYEISKLSPKYVTDLFSEVCFHQTPKKKQKNKQQQKRSDLEMEFYKNFCSSVL